MHMRGGEILDHAADAFGRGVWAMMFTALFMVGAGVVAGGMYGAAFAISRTINFVSPLIRWH